jgi:hypothetical protein
VHVRACFAALTLCACGRIGFEQPPRHGDAAIDDAAPVAGFIVSQTLLSSFVGFTWVAVDVDWSRRLAYLATRETGRCVAVVDFTDELHPQIIQRIDGGRTTCLGVALDGNASRLVVLSYGAGQVALFDLGADPRAGTYASLDVATVPGPRHFAIDRGVSPSRVYVARQVGQHRWLPRRGDRRCGRRVDREGRRLDRGAVDRRDRPPARDRCLAARRRRGGVRDPDRP